ncbi:MAG: cytochrome c oxidase assembly protein [Thermomicrobiales bacterium]
MVNLPTLHSGVGFPTGWLHSDWRIDPSVLLVAFAMAAGYTLLTGTRNAKRPDAAERLVSTGQRVRFLLGCVVFVVALGPPLDDWSDNYLLTAHMAQHMLLMYVVAPLWLSGTPTWLLAPLTRQPIMHQIGYAITRFAPALVISNALVIFWHLPGVYDRALQSEPIHVMQHGVFLIAALLAWWPVLGPLPAWPRLSEPLQCLYLFLTSLPSGLVGAFITFAAVPAYTFYGNTPRIFGISLEVDQQAAGLMMWVGGSSIYFLWITAIFLRWGGRSDAEEHGSLSIPAFPDPDHTTTR